MRNLSSGFNFVSYGRKSRCYLLAFLNCIFEAQINDLVIFEQMILARELKVDLSNMYIESN